MSLNIIASSFAFERKSRLCQKFSHSCNDGRLRLRLLRAVIVITVIIEVTLLK